jgi:hypothetical protein
MVAVFLTRCAFHANAQSEDVQVVKKTTQTSGLDTPDLVSREAPASCPLTMPQNPPFTPPPPYDTMGYQGEFWYGTNALWTAVRENGTWEALPHNPEGYTQKVFWWRDGYAWIDEPEPELIVTAERLDGHAPLVKASKATNASAADIGSAMLVGVDLPTLGCWKITGKYDHAELSFVVWVAP